MDSDGNGKGEMWIGAPGWASANVNQVKVRDYGLMDFIEPIRAEESVKTARVKDSIAKNEGYAFYCYKPHAIWYMFDIYMLSEPKYDPAKYVMVQPSDSPDWFKKSKVATKDASEERANRVVQLAQGAVTGHRRVFRAVQAQGGRRQQALPPSFG